MESKKYVKLGGVPSSSSSKSNGLSSSSSKIIIKSGTQITALDRKSTNTCKSIVPFEALSPIKKKFNYDIEALVTINSDGSYKFQRMSGGSESKVVALGGIKEFSQAMMDDQISSHYKSLKDLLIVCQDGCIYSHRSILMCCSNFFRSIFMEEKGKPFTILTFEDIKIKEFSYIINSMYFGEIVITPQGSEIGGIIGILSALCTPHSYTITKAREEDIQPLQIKIHPLEEQFNAVQMYEVGYRKCETQNACTNTEDINQIFPLGVGGNCGVNKNSTNPQLALLNSGEEDKSNELAKDKSKDPIMHLIPLKQQEASTITSLDGSVQISISFGPLEASKDESKQTKEISVPLSAANVSDSLLAVPNAVVSEVSIQNEPRKSNEKPSKEIEATSLNALVPYAQPSTSTAISLVDPAPKSKLNTSNGDADRKRKKKGKRGRPRKVTRKRRKTESSSSALDTYTPPYSKKSSTDTSSSTISMPNLTSQVQPIRRTNRKTLKCIYCNYTTKLYDELSTHLSKKCGTLLTGKFTYTADVQQCLICEQVFDGAESYDFFTHMKDCERTARYRLESKKAREEMDSDTPSSSSSEEDSDQSDIANSSRRIVMKPLNIVVNRSDVEEYLRRREARIQVKIEPPELVSLAELRRSSRRKKVIPCITLSGSSEEESESEDDGPQEMNQRRSLENDCEQVVIKYCRDNQIRGPKLYKRRLVRDNLMLKCQICKMLHTSFPGVHSCLSSHQKLRCYICFGTMELGKVGTRKEDIAPALKKHLFDNHRNPTSKLIWCPECKLNLKWEDANKHILNIHYMIFERLEVEENGDNQAERNKDPPQVPIPKPNENLGGSELPVNEGLSTLKDVGSGQKYVVTLSDLPVSEKQRGSSTNTTMSDMSEITQANLPISSEKVLHRVVKVNNEAYKVYKRQVHNSSFEPPPLIDLEEDPPAIDDTAVNTSSSTTVNGIPSKSTIEPAPTLPAPNAPFQILSGTEIMPGTEIPISYLREQGLYPLVSSESNVISNGSWNAETTSPGVNPNSFQFAMNQMPSTSAAANNPLGDSIGLEDVITKSEIMVQHDDSSSHSSSCDDIHISKLFLDGNMVRKSVNLYRNSANTLNCPNCNEIFLTEKMLKLHNCVETEGIDWDSDD